MPHPCCKDPGWQFDSICEHCALCNNTFLTELPRSERDRIFLSIELLKFSPGTVIYHEGNSDNYIYAIRSGLIKQIQYMPNGSYRILRLSRPNDTIGLERFSGDVYEHTAITINHVEACRIPIAVLDQINHDNPWMYEKFMKQWRHESQEADKWITEFSTGTIQTRVVRLILFLSDMQKNAKIAQVELLNREDMAAIIGTTVESTSRVIGRLKREALLRPMQKGSREVYDFEISALNALVLKK
jgi:CRP/FNR family transcriptional regulator